MLVIIAILSAIVNFALMCAGAAVAASAIGSPVPSGWIVFGSLVGSLVMPFVQGFIQASK